MSLKDQFKAKLVESLNEDVYKVKHEGHPDAATNNLYKHLPTGKKYTNLITKFPDSAKKAADNLKKAGFKGVEVYKNWKLMEDVELDEAFNAEKKWPHGGSVMVGVNPRASKLPRYTVLFAPNKDPKRLTRGGLKTREVSHHEDESEAKSAADAYATKFGYQRMKPMGESIELEEGKMSELHADISDHMDKHIGEYKRAGGAEALMAHAARATHKIAKLHGIEHKHAEKFVNDYIDSKLNEETLSESREIKIGDSVHVGLIKKGGTGFEGVVTHMDQANDKITLRSHHKEKFGYHTYRGRLSNATHK